MKRGRRSAVANIGSDELRAKIDGGEPFVLLEVLAPRYYRHSHVPGTLNLPPGKVAEMGLAVLQAFLNNGEHLR